MVIIIIWLANFKHPFLLISELGYPPLTKNCELLSGACIYKIGASICEVYLHKTSLTRHCEANMKPGKWAVMYLCDRMSILILLRFFYWIVEMSPQCETFCFVFYFISMIIIWNWSDNAVILLWFVILLEGSIISIIAYSNPFEFNLTVLITAISIDRSHFTYGK